MQISGKFCNNLLFHYYQIYHYKYMHACKKIESMTSHIKSENVSNNKRKSTIDDDN